jgi:hypothetical protein
MQQRQRPYHNLRSKPHQLDLFAPPIVRGATPVPDWRTLPAASREALTALIARLILNHVHGERQADGEEVRRDD